VKTYVRRSDDPVFLAPGPEFGQPSPDRNEHSADFDFLIGSFDAAIVRIYNRSMRRWESLYMTNRGNSVLFFGGRMEGDEMVLVLFDTDLGGGPLTRFVFHDMRPDGYSWFSEVSNDRGATFKKTWLIGVNRSD
jgi:hypothetical protein